MGVVKPAEEAIHITMKNGIGSTPSCVAIDNASGNASAAAALLVMSSVMRFVMM